ncbi:hypothetical protein MBLNU230_g1315t1 [Neophaeotheca triangularis]
MPFGLSKNKKSSEKEAEATTTTVNDGKEQNQAQDTRRFDAAAADPSFVHPGFKAQGNSKPLSEPTDVEARDRETGKTNGAKFGVGRFLGELVPSIRGV